MLNPLTVYDIYDGDIRHLIGPVFKIMKNDILTIFLEREQNLLQNSILIFAFRLNQSSVIAFQSWILHTLVTLVKKQLFKAAQLKV